MKAETTDFEPGKDPHVDWQHAWDNGLDPRKLKHAREPVSAHYPTRRNYAPHAPILSERLGRVARIRGALEHLMLAGSTSVREALSVKRFLGRLDRLQRGWPQQTDVIVIRRSGQAVILIDHPSFPVDRRPRLVTRWSERFLV